jgi:hypothetical protein
LRSLNGEQRTNSEQHNIAQPLTYMALFSVYMVHDNDPNLPASIAAACLAEIPYDIQLAPLLLRETVPAIVGGGLSI